MASLPTAMNLGNSARPRGPDFLGVGAQRSGTSWLHFTLKRHPAIWLPPIKEIHHFDNAGRLRLWADPKRWRRAWGTRIGIFDRWMTEYLLGDGSDDWYAKLFYRAQLSGRIAGEITPAYATLTQESFRRILQLNKDVKIIFVMRDPVQRAWSAANRSLPKRGRRTREPLKLDAAVEAALRRQHLARSAYTKTIRSLEAVFPSQQLYYCFFDDLCTHPVKFVSGILSFLEVDERKAAQIVLPAVNSPMGGRPAPREFELRMAKCYLPMIRELCKRFEGPPQKWLARYERLLSSPILN